MKLLSACCVVTIAAVLTVSFLFLEKSKISSRLADLVLKEVENNALNDGCNQSAEEALPTRFTDHVLGIIHDLNPTSNDFHECTIHFTFLVSEPDSIPHVHCYTVRDAYCPLFQRIFASRPLPYNVSIGFLLNDFFVPKDRCQYNHCIGSSSPNGQLVMPNMEEINGMGKFDKNTSLDPLNYRRRKIPQVSWEMRTEIPIFRGTFWFHDSLDVNKVCIDPGLVFNDSLVTGHSRFKAVAFSRDHPTLLDAKFSGLHPEVLDCCPENSTNGLCNLLPMDVIPTKTYFSQYRVALVLGGIGAPFRLSQHLEMETAVLLEDFQYQEWFTKYLIPYVHFIPLAEDLHDLYEKLLWIKSNPETIKSIAHNGRLFWLEYLSFARNEEHIYELIYRMAEKRRYVEATATEFPGSRQL